MKKWLLSPFIPFIPSVSFGRDRRRGRETRTEFKFRGSSKPMHFHQHVLRRCGSFGGLSQSQGRYQVIAVCLLASTVSGCVPFGEGHGLPPYKYLSVASVQAISSDGLARADRIRADNSMAGGRRALGSYVLDEPGLSLEIRHAEWMGESSAVKFRVKNASGSAFTVDPMRCEFVPTQQRLRRHVGAQGRPAELLVAAHELDGGDRGGPRIVFVAHTWEGTPGWDSLKHIQILAALEDEFKVEIAHEDIIEMVSIPAVIRILGKYIS